MKLLIIQFSPTSYDFIPLRSKYSPQHPVLWGKRNGNEVFGFWTTAVLWQICARLRAQIQNFLVIKYSNFLTLSLSGRLQNFPEHLISNACIPYSSFRREHIS
jgi:hypothetical protein